MKHHLRSKYEKYENYDDNDLERSILSFLNEYVSEMKGREEVQQQSNKKMIGPGKQLIYTSQAPPGQDNYNPNIFLNQPSEISDDRPDADVAEFEYGQTTPRSMLNSTLDWNDPDKISKRIKR